MGGRWEGVGRALGGSGGVGRALESYSTSGSTSLGLDSLIIVLSLKCPEREVGQGGEGD